MNIRKKQKCQPKRWPLQTWAFGYALIAADMTKIEIIINVRKLFQPSKTFQQSGDTLCIQVNFNISIRYS